MGPEKAVVIHDGFRFDAWRDFLADGENVVLDAHWYLGMAGDPTLTAADYMHRILAEHVDRLRAATLPVIMGEWCLAHRAPEASPPGAGAALPPDRRRSVDRLESCLGHFFWSYKLISQPDGWDLVPVHRPGLARKSRVCIEGGSSMKIRNQLCLTEVWPQPPHPARRPPRRRPPPPGTRAGPGPARLGERLRPTGCCSITPCGRPVAVSEVHHPLCAHAA